MGDTNGTGRKKTQLGRQHTLTLSNGEKVRVRRPSSFHLIASGGIPAELTSVVWKLFGETTRLSKIMEQGEGLKEYTGLLGKYIPHVVLSPRIVTDKVDSKTGEVIPVPTECEVGEDGILIGILNIADIPDLDQNDIFLYGIGIGRGDEEQPPSPGTPLAEQPTELSPPEVAAALTTFRDGAPGPVPGDGGAEVRPAPIGASGPGPGESLVA